MAMPTFANEAVTAEQVDANKEIVSEVNVNNEMTTESGEPNKEAAPLSARSAFRSAVVANAPTVEPQTNGDVLIKLPQDNADITNLTVTYIDQETGDEYVVEGVKENGVWSIPNRVRTYAVKINPERIVADEAQAAKLGKPVGTITIPAALVKDGSEVKAQTGIAGNGVFTSSDEVVGVAKKDVVAQIKTDYDITFDVPNLANRPTDRGFVFNEDKSSLIYFYNVDDKTQFSARDVLKVINAAPKTGKDFRALDGTEKYKAEAFMWKENDNGFSLIHTEPYKNFYRLDGYLTEILDLIEPINHWGDVAIYPNVPLYGNLKRNIAGFLLATGTQPVKVDVSEAVTSIAIPERNASTFDLQGSWAKANDNDEKEYGVIPGSIQRRFLVNTQYVFNSAGEYKKYRANPDGSNADGINSVENIMNVYFVGYTELPPAPVVTPKDNGGATVSLSEKPYPNEIVELTVEYTKEDDSKATITAKKTNGNWELTTQVEGVSIDPATGVITFVPDAIKDDSPITSTVKDNLGKTSKVGEGTSKYDIIMPELTFVKNPDDLTDAEKTSVEEAVRKANPNFPENTKVEVGTDGSVTVTYPDGNVEMITQDKTVRKIPTTEVIFVKDTDKLTDEEKTKVEDKLKEMNPDLPKDIVLVVADNGNLTVTYPDGAIIEIEPAKTVRKIPTTEVIFVKDTDKLTDEEKTKVEDKLKEMNPDLPKDIVLVVADNGNLTVTYPDGAIIEIEPAKTVRKIPTTEVIEVVNINMLTDEEKVKVADKLKEMNPDLPKDVKIVVADNGELTVTYSDGTVFVISQEKTVKMMPAVDMPEANKPAETQKMKPKTMNKAKSPKTSDNSAVEVTVLGGILSAGAISLL